MWHGKEIKKDSQGASEQFMNQHLLVKMRQLGVAILGNSFAKAGSMSGAQPMSESNALAVAIALGLTCDCRLPAGVLRIW